MNTSTSIAQRQDHVELYQTVGAGQVVIPEDNNGISQQREIMLADLQSEE